MYKSSYLVFSLIMLSISASIIHASGSEFECNGYNTLLYSNSNLSFAVCHSSHMKINRKHLEQWQNCVDAFISKRDKKNNKTVLLTDCSPISQKEFKVANSSIHIKYYYEQFPEHDLVPFIIESHNTDNSDTNYELISQPTIYTKTEIISSINLIVKTLKEPFNGATYFKYIYSGFL